VAIQGHVNYFMAIISQMVLQIQGRIKGWLLGPKATGLHGRFLSSPVSQPVAAGRPQAD